MVVCEPSLLHLSHHLILRILLLVPTLTTCYFGIPLFTPHSVLNEWSWCTEHTPGALSDKTENSQHATSERSNLPDSTFNNDVSSQVFPDPLAQVRPCNSQWPLPSPLACNQPSIKTRRDLQIRSAEIQQSSSIRHLLCRHSCTAPPQSSHRHREGQFHGWMPRREEGLLHSYLSRNLQSTRPSLYVLFLLLYLKPASIA